MVLKSNDFGSFAFCHIPTMTVYELYSRDRYNANMNIYATAWQIGPNWAHAHQVESFDKLLITDVPRRGSATELATGEALNKLHSHISA